MPEKMERAFCIGCNMIFFTCYPDRKERGICPACDPSTPKFEVNGRNM